MNLIHPKLVPYVTALTSHEFGLQGALAEIENIECGSIVSNLERRWGDRFYLRILYCTKRLSWQVLMNPDNLMEPPDFIMEDDFLADADLEIIQTQVPSLAHWKPSDPNCLLNIVLELLKLYKQYQCDFLTMNRESRLCFEYDFLINCLNKTFSDIEIYVHNAARISFLFHLNIDFSGLPIQLPKQKYLVLLLIEIGDTTKNIVSLRKPVELDFLFAKLELPELSSNMILAEYVYYIEEQLQLMVNDAVQNMQKRKLLYSYLMAAFEPAILNGDNITFQSISFLLEVNKQFYVMNIEIPFNFPTEQPKLNVSMMRKLQMGRNFFTTLKNFNYDPQWKLVTIFKNLYEYIKNRAIPDYNKMVSNSDGRSEK